MWRKIGKVLVLGIAVVLVVLIASHFVWKYSGSNTWVPVINKNGVTIYTLKAPGFTLKRFRGVTHVRTTLNRAVAAMVSTDTADCDEWSPGCKSEKTIQAWNSHDLTYTQLYSIPFPPPFSTRELLIHAQVSQDLPSKSVLVDFRAAPDALPRNACCFRVEGLHNSWRYTPLENGEVEVEGLFNTDPGGATPYFLVNRIAPRSFYEVFLHLQKFLDKPKWQNARFDRIQEK